MAAEKQITTAFYDHGARRLALEVVGAGFTHHDAAVLESCRFTTSDGHRAGCAPVGSLGFVEAEKVKTTNVEKLPRSNRGLTEIRWDKENGGWIVAETKRKVSARKRFNKVVIRGTQVFASV